MRPSGDVLNPEMGTAGATITPSTRRSFPSADVVVPAEGWVSYTTNREPAPVFLLRATFEGKKPLIMHNSRVMVMQAEWAKTQRSKNPPPDDLYCEWASYRDNPNDPHRFITEPFVLCLDKVRDVVIKPVGQNRRQSISQIVRGALIPIDDYASITSDPEGTEFIYDHEKFYAPVVVNKARVMRVRPRIHPPWYITVIFEYRHPTIYGEEVWMGLHEAWRCAGSNVGIGDYRPQNKGSHGLFAPISVDVVRMR